MTREYAFVCIECGQRYAIDTRDWSCTCGGLFDFDHRPPFDTGLIDSAISGPWRYRAMLPLEPDWEAVTLGEGNTSLVPIEWYGHRLVLKMEMASPTGCFKDRGATLLVTALHGMGIQRVVEDSSGNAGASLAAYAGRAGIRCEVCIPSSASRAKLAQIEAYGAEVIEIRGKREYAALAAWAAAAHGAYYASHVYSPYFSAGIETMAYELWEQLGRRAPDALLMPVGNGSLLLGAYHGFLRLNQAGLAAKVPRLFAVQTAACAPLFEAYRSGAHDIEAVSVEPTMASGIAIAHPARGSQILEAVRATAGAVLRVSEDKIAQTYHELACQGLYVEKTAAVPVAAVEGLAQLLGGDLPESVIVPLTGHGLKLHPGA